MASSSSMATLSRRLCLSLLSSSSKSMPKPTPFCTDTTTTTTAATLPELDDTILNSDPESVLDSPTPEESTQQRTLYDRPLENGLDVGIYKAILVGQVGLRPLQKRLKSGRTVTMFSLGTGGIRNNRRPLDNEEPRDYANRCAVQWHRVSVYPERLGNIAMKHIVPGSLLYLEGNLETKIFSDPITGLVRRVREVALRRNGRIVFLGKDADAQQTTQKELKGVGYY